MTNKEQKVFHIGDTHFYDDGIIRVEDRPFKTVEEMNQAIIDNWNSHVGEDDIVWHHGDVGSCNWHGVTYDYISMELKKVIGKLNGHKYLIMGNHDRDFSEDWWKSIGFEKVYDHPVLYNDWYILSHEPTYISHNMPYCNIFAHVHGNPNFARVSKAGACVSCERWSFAPVSNDCLVRNIYNAIDRNETKHNTGDNAIRLMKGYVKSVGTFVNAGSSDAAGKIFDTMLDLTQAIVRSASGDTVFCYIKDNWYEQVGHPVKFLNTHTNKWIYGTICAGYCYKNGFVTCKENGSTNPIIATFPDWKLDSMFKNPLIHDDEEEDNEE